MRLSKMTTGLIACLPLLTFEALATETLEAKVNLDQYSNQKIERGFIIIRPTNPKIERGHIIIQPTKPK